LFRRLGVRSGWIKAAPLRRFDAAFFNGKTALLLFIKNCLSVRPPVNFPA